MRGDLVNLLAFVATVPGYYYKAITYYNYSQQQQQEEQLLQVQQVQQRQQQLNLDLIKLVNDKNSSSTYNNNICRKQNSNANDDTDNNNDDDTNLCQVEELENVETTIETTTTTTNSRNLNSDIDNNTEDDDVPVLPPVITVVASIQEQCIVCISFTITIIITLVSIYLQNNATIAFVSFILSWISVMFSNTYQWPHYNEQTLIPQFIWHFMIMNCNNISYYYQIIQGLVSLLFGCYIASYPPYNLHDTFPIFFGISALHIAFHTSLLQINSKNSNANSNNNEDDLHIISLRNDTFRTTFASVILTTTFAYHVFNEVVMMFSQDNYAVIGGFSILRAGFFASFGIFAAGAFKNESLQNDILEQKVKSRTKQIVQQSQKLQLVEIALEASETAIAITDHQMIIVWCNPAFNRLITSTTTTITTTIEPNGNNVNQDLTSTSTETTNGMTTVTSESSSAAAFDIASPTVSTVSTSTSTSSTSSTSSKSSNNNNNNYCSLLDVLETSTIDREKISSCFDCYRTMEDEITIRNLTIHIQVGPFVDNMKSMLTNSNCKEQGDDVEDDDYYYHHPSIDNNNNNFDNNNMNSNGTSNSTIRTSTYNNNNNNNNNTNNKTSRFIVVMKDFTERRKRQLAEQAAEREMMLKQAMFESCQILSHELRTPLQGIMGITSMLLDEQKDVLTNDVEEAMSLVMVSSRLLLTLINNMLDVRKCDANMMSEFGLVPTELYQPLDDAVNFCRPLGLLSNLTITFIPSTVKNIYALSDPLRLQQIVINLVSNSIKHSPSGGTITISATVSSIIDAEILVQNSICSGTAVQEPGKIQEDPTSEKQQTDDETMATTTTSSSCSMDSQQKVVIVSVSDTGNGIDIEQGGKLFQQFAQLEEHASVDNSSTGGTSTTTTSSTTTNSISGTTVGQPSGTGLGLNLCLKFVHRMGGKIWASNNNTTTTSSSEDNNTTTKSTNGATFSFYLPLYVPDHNNNTGMNGTVTTALSRCWPSQSDLSSLDNTDSSVPMSLFAELILLKELRVLVVDDTFINLKVLDRMLRTIGITTVVCVDSGYKALTTIELANDSNESFHLIISDIQMPGMTGIELCEIIVQKYKNNDPTQEPIIVGLTAEDSKSLDEKCSIAGMAHVLHKPITSHQLKDFFDKLCPS